MARKERFFPDFLYIHAKDGVFATESYHIAFQRRVLSKPDDNPESKASLQDIIRFHVVHIFHCHAVLPRDADISSRDEDVILRKHCIVANLLARFCTYIFFPERASAETTNRVLL